MPEDRSWEKQLAMQWKRATPFLAAQRRRDIRRQNKAQAFAALDAIFNHAIKTRPPKRTSGLVEMYKILMRSTG